MESLNVRVHKDSATTIDKVVTREEAEGLSTQFKVEVATPDGFVGWQEFVDAGVKAEKAQAAAVLASLLKRKEMTKTAFGKLDDDVQDKMLLEEAALMASEANIEAGKAGPQVVLPGSTSAV